MPKQHNRITKANIGHGLLSIIFLLIQLIGFSQEALEPLKTNLPNSFPADTAV